MRPHLTRHALERGSEHLLWVLILGTVALPWWKWAGASFWLDEAITNCVVSDGVESVLRRSLTYQGQSPLYFLMAWCIRASGFHSEVALRLPSAIFCGLTLWTFNRLASAVLNPRVALAATCVL